MQDSRIPAERSSNTWFTKPRELHQVKSSQHSGRPQKYCKGQQKWGSRQSFRKTWGIAEVLAEEIKANEQNQSRSVLL